MGRAMFTLRGHAWAGSLTEAVFETWLQEMDSSILGEERLDSISSLVEYDCRALWRT